MGESFSKVSKGRRSFYDDKSWKKALLTHIYWIKTLCLLHLLPPCPEKLHKGLCPFRRKDMRGQIFKHRTQYCVENIGY
jgi:hypothetical protein